MAITQFGRYQIKSEIGRGGMATVYLAYDPRFERDVAIKVLPPEFLHNPTFRARFEREAKTIAALDHTAIVPVFDFGEENGQPFLVMRYMTGGSLLDRLKKGSLSVAEANRIISHLAPALDEAHSRKIIHRDMKPGNILFDRRGLPSITDFGIVKLGEQFTSLTGGGIVGTPAYMSPEQARGEAGIDGRTDIYALGAILFEMLTGHVPFEAETPTGQIIKALTEPVPRILDYQPGLPCDCQGVIEKAMAKQKEDRYATAGKMVKALEAVVRNEMQSASIPEVDEKLTEIPSEIIFEEVLPGAPTQQDETKEGQIALTPVLGEETWREQAPLAETESFETIQPVENVPQLNIPLPVKEPSSEIIPLPVQPHRHPDPSAKARQKTAVWVWVIIGIVMVGLCIGLVGRGMLSSIITGLFRTSKPVIVVTQTSVPIPSTSSTKPILTSTVTLQPSSTPTLTTTPLSTVTSTPTLPIHTSTPSFTPTQTPTSTFTPFIPPPPTPTKEAKRPKPPTKTPVPP